MYLYIFQPKAQMEYEDSIIWYAKRSIVAAENFIKEIDVTLEKICSFPLRWKNDFLIFYEFNLKKYPFTIMYSIDEVRKIVIVMSIFHQKRNPTKKHK